MKFTWWPELLAERVAALNAIEPPLFLPTPFIVSRVLPCIVGVACGVSILYNLFYYFIIPQRQKDQRPVLEQQRQHRKLCYQLTNLVTNLCLGIAGLYYECSLFTDNSLSVEQTTTGYLELVDFSAVQIGYQLWAIPMGIWYTREPWNMIVHHFTVIVCASMSGFLTYGFRYWTPFFYGLVELSSVPLAIMNIFKDNPNLIKRHPLIYKNVRLWFAFSFLYIRILLFVPRQYMFLRDQFLLFTTRPVVPYQIFMATVWISAFFLLILQLYWGRLIVKGLLYGTGSSSSSSNGGGAAARGNHSRSTTPSTATDKKGI